MDLKNRRYNPKHDAYYDIEKNEWLEKTCSDTACIYCKGRPEKPLHRLKDKYAIPAGPKQPFPGR